MEDSLIIELFHTRNEDAIAQMQTKYGAYCMRIASNLLSREDAEECVNDTFLAVWNAIPPAKPSDLKAYLGKTARNLAINRYQKNHAKKRHYGIAVLLSELEDCIPSPDTAERGADSRELTAVINAWLGSLDKDDRVLFARRYWYGASLKELAKERNISPGKLAQRMHRLRLSLRLTLEQEGITV